MKRAQTVMPVQRIGLGESGLLHFLFTDRPPFSVWAIDLGPQSAGTRCGGVGVAEQHRCTHAERERHAAAIS